MRLSIITSSLLNTLCLHDTEFGCQALNPPDNGYITYGPADTVAPFIPDTEAIYGCNDGFQLVGGDSVLVCQNDGTWAGTMPTGCVGEMINEIKCDLSSCKVWHAVVMTI